MLPEMDALIDLYSSIIHHTGSDLRCCDWIQTANALQTPMFNQSHVAEISRRQVEPKPYIHIHDYIILIAVTT